jgi:hypothetical protein
MKIKSGPNYLELEVQLETDSSLPSCGDALIGIVVSSNGYSGKNQVWVAKQELELFSAVIIKLEKNRKGEAVINSMSPGELSLRVYSYDSVGHMAIEGITGHPVIGSVTCKHSVQFGFTIEPEQLVKLSKAKWLNQNNA